MKVVNRDEFLKLPGNVLFMPYFERDGICSPFSVKHETLENDWIESGAAEPFHNDYDSLAYVHGMISKGESVPFTATIKGRNGEFNEDDRFTILEKADLLHLRNLIDKALGEEEGLKERVVYEDNINKYKLNLEKREKEVEELLKELNSKLKELEGINNNPL